MAPLRLISALFAGIIPQAKFDVELTLRLSDHLLDLDQSVIGELY